MRSTSPDWTDEQFDAVLAHVLRVGVLLSAAIVTCGGVVFLRSHWWQMPAYQVFKGEPDALRTVKGIISNARTLSGRGLVQFGLLVLIATPIARVLLSVFGFARQRDWLYVAMTLAVLVLLAYGLLSA